MYQEGSTCAYHAQHAHIVYTEMASKTRGYVSIGYTESLDEEFIEKLEETHVQCLISPLHDKDVDANGNTKKEHYHIMLLFDGPKTIDQAQAIFDSIGAIKCKAINSVRGQARYLCHLDDPDKAQYDQGDVTCLNGADFFGLIDLPGNKYQAIREMMAYCNENGIRSFSDLTDYAANYNETWFRSLCDNSAYIMKEYLKSRSWKYNSWLRERGLPDISHDSPGKEIDDDE